MFRLLALKEAGANDEAIRGRGGELRQTQRADGGVGPARRLPSDAYATGSALVALHRGRRAGDRRPGVPPRAWFLLRTQQPDGTWFVKSRSKPFQPYYESGFPLREGPVHLGAASGWATAALAAACESRAVGRK